MVDSHFSVPEWLLPVRPLQSQQSRLRRRGVGALWQRYTRFKFCIIQVVQIISAYLHHDSCILHHASALSAELWHRSPLPTSGADLTETSVSKVKNSQVSCIRSRPGVIHRLLPQGVVRDGLGQRAFLESGGGA